LGFPTRPIAAVVWAPPKDCSEVVELGVEKLLDFALPEVPESGLCFFDGETSALLMLKVLLLGLALLPGLGWPGSSFIALELELLPSVRSGRPARGSVDAGAPHNFAPADVGGADWAVADSALSCLMKSALICVSNDRSF
jgi:hypothetical protein